MTSKIVDFDTKTYPTFEDGRRQVMLFVLVERAEGTFRVYAAIVPHDDDDPDYERAQPWVYKYGSALRESEAVAIWDHIAGRYAR